LKINLFKNKTGAETGVELADQLSFYLKLRSNGIEGF
jgi:hypothetical protein